jgi:hypothetical protein
LFISSGSWKDIIVILQYDLVYNGWGKESIGLEKIRRQTKGAICYINNSDSKNNKR